MTERRTVRPSFMLVAPNPDGPSTGRPGLARRPALRAVARRTLPRLVEAMVIPAVLLYVFLVFANLAVAMVIVLCWTYGAVLQRTLRRAPVPGLLALAAVGLTVRTVFALCSGSSLVYFLQPIGTTTLGSALLLGSVALRRPLAGRFAADFCPLAPEVATRPAVIRLFRDLTVLWSAVQLGKAVTSFAMLVVMPTPTFVASKALSGFLLTGLGIVLTVMWSLRTAHSEGLVFARMPAGVLRPV
jgi:hypothetical protein